MAAYLTVRQYRQAAVNIPTILELNDVFEETINTCNSSIVHTVNVTTRGKCIQSFLAVTKQNVKIAVIPTAKCQTNKATKTKELIRF
jgi:hypothetical protein